VINKPKILIISGGLGHRSMAEAVEAGYKKAGFQVKLKKLVPKDKLGTTSGFGLIYSYFPFLMNVSYEIGRKFISQKTWDTLVGKKNLKEAKEEIIKFKPDIVLSTAFYLDPIIKRIRSSLKRHFFYFYLTHEPWADHHLLYPNRPDLTFVYDHKAEKIAQKWITNKEKIATIGWSIRPRFYKNLEKDKKDIFKKFSFKKDIFTVLISAGSGTTMVLKILPALFKVTNPIQVIFISGRDKNTYRMAKATAKILNKSFANWESRVKMKVLGFTKQIDKYIKAADIVVGKAGPQLLFESVAARKPFFVITHLTGSQDSLLELIKKKKLGYVEERPQRAIKLFLKISKSQEKALKRFKPNIERERQYNIKAEDKLIGETLKFWKEKSKK